MRRLLYASASQVQADEGANLRGLRRFIHGRTNGCPKLFERLSPVGVPMAAWVTPVAFVASSADRRCSAATSFMKPFKPWPGVTVLATRRRSGAAFASVRAAIRNSPPVEGVRVAIGAARIFFYDSAVS